MKLNRYIYIYIYIYILTAWVELQAKASDMHAKEDVQISSQTLT